MSTFDQPIPAPPPPPAEAAAVPTSFDSLTVKARRVPNSDSVSGRWELYTTLNGVPWVISAKKLGGLDDDLQEQATPGFKEARAERYAKEVGRPRTEPGPGAKTA